MKYVSQNGIGQSSYIDFEDGSPNHIYIGSESWGSGNATLMYSPDGVLSGAPLRYNNGNLIQVSGNIVVEMYPCDGKLGILVDTDDIIVNLNIAGSQNPFN